MKIAILGAGISGLALAHFLQKEHGNGVEITIFEASSQPGGWLSSFCHEGAVFERGPRSLRSSSYALDQLILDLGLEKEMLYPPQEASRRYIAESGQLAALPDSLKALFCSKLGRLALVSIVREPFSSKGPASDESVESFFYRRIGKRATDTFISALTAGIYAGCPDRLSMRSSFNALWRKEQDFGSLVFGMLFSKKEKPYKIFSFKEGVSTLPKRLVETTKAKILYNTPILSAREDHQSVHVVAGKAYAFDFLFLSSRNMAKILPDNDPMKPLVEIPTTSVATVSLAYKEAQKLPAGFGFLCPKEEDPVLLGVVFDSNIFPEQNGSFKTRLSVMMGGTKCPDLLSYSDEVLVAYARAYVQKYLQVAKREDFHLVTRAGSAISSYPVGHYRTLEALDGKMRRIIPFGSSLHGVSVADSVTSAHTICKKIG